MAGHAGTPSITRCKAQEFRISCLGRWFRPLPQVAQLMVAFIIASAACVYLWRQAKAHAGAEFFQERYEPRETARYQRVAEFHLLHHDCVCNSDGRLSAVEKAMNVYYIEDSKDDDSNGLSAFQVRVVRRTASLTVSGEKMPYRRRLFSGYPSAMVLQAPKQV